MTGPVSIALALALGAVLQGGFRPQPIPHRVNLSVLRDWTDAVQRHMPGEADAAALVPSTWTVPDLEGAWTDLQLFAALLNDVTRNAFQIRPSRRSVLLRRDELEALRDLARVVRQRMTPDLFLKRAAVLHTDVVMLILRDDDLSFVSTSPLLPRTVLIKTQDGQQVATLSGSLHWDLARVLLDAVPDPSRDEFVRRWYRATLAHKLVQEQLDTPHFEHALRRLADDAEIQFQVGCLHEAFANPRATSVTRNLVLPAPMGLAFESEARELRQARDSFRRALAVNAKHAEARLRHGRVLGRLGDHKDAAAELRLALSATRERLLLYYAQLFLGAEEEALNRSSEARAAYEAALKLYPDSQAPRLALSQLAHRTGNRVAARAALAAVLQPSAAKSGTDDPWWDYQFVAGRRAGDLMAAVHRSLGAAPPP